MVLRAKLESSQVGVVEEKFSKTRTSDEIFQLTPQINVGDETSSKEIQPSVINIKLPLVEQLSSLDRHPELKEKAELLAYFWARAMITTNLLLSAKLDQSNINVSLFESLVLIFVEEFTKKTMDQFAEFCEAELDKQKSIDEFKIIAEVVAKKILEHTVESQKAEINPLGQAVSVSSVGLYSVSNNPPRTTKDAVPNIATTTLHPPVGM